MAERFNLTAQMQLQAPTNTAQVVGQIRKQLKGINVDVKVKANTPQVAKLNKELQGVSKASDASAKPRNCTADIFRIAAPDSLPCESSRTVNSSLGYCSSNSLPITGSIESEA